MRIRSTSAPATSKVGIRARSMTALAAAGFLLLDPATAAANPPADPPTASLSPGSQTGVADAGAAGAADAADLATRATSRPVAPGVRQERVETFGAAGWQVANAITVDVTAGASVGLLWPGSLTGPAPLPEQADVPGVVAGVNADFFDINNSGAPLGAVVADSRLLKSPTASWTRVAAFDEAGAGRITDIAFDGSVELPEATVRLDRLNASDLPAGGIGAYDTHWGEYPRTRAVDDADESAMVAEVVVTDGIVTEVRDTPGAGTLKEGEIALVGREAGAATLTDLAEGDPVEVRWSAEAVDGEPVHTAVGGRQVLVRDGVAQDVDAVTYAARTAVGMSADGGELVLLTTDGALQSHSRGATLAEMADLMVARGVDQAIELDGGGSSTLVSRRPGQEGVQVDNTPNDGHLRAVPNGLGIFVPDGDGMASGLVMGTALDPELAPTDAPVTGAGRTDRVLAGLTRTIAATPHDDAFGPVASRPRLDWSATGGSIAPVDADDGRHPAMEAVLTAGEPGTATVTASVGAGGPLSKPSSEPASELAERFELEVIGEPSRLRATERSVNIPSLGDVATFGLIGYDAMGNSAPVEPRDVTLSYDRDLLDISADDLRGFVATPRAGGGSTLVELTVGDLTTTIGVSVGTERHVLDTFDDPSGWYARGTRATAEVTPVEDGEDGPGLRLSYDFTQATATRLGIAELTEPLGMPGQARAFGLSVHGNGVGEWTAFTFVDADGNELPAVYGPYVDWEGWRTVELAVPEGFPQRLAFKRLTMIETQASRQYEGSVVIDNLYVKVAPEVEPPPEPLPVDPIVVQDATVDDHGWRFAVFNDAQFVARDPDSPQAEGARRTLREIKAAGPDFFVIAGDFVDEGSDADFELARRILDEEIGDAVPYYYVPGNHEVMGADISNFERHFGPTHRVFDHRGTRFITLDTSRGTLRGGGFDQVAMFRRALDEAADDPAVESVVVIQHHAPRDPTPAKNSRLADRHEAALLERWLAEFARDTAKGAAFVGGHLGLFHTSRVDTVPYVVLGNSGKAPAGAVVDGGFTGWALFGVEPPAESGSPWLEAEIRPHVDELEVSVPGRLGIGEAAVLSATVRQGDPGSVRQVPVDHQVTANWQPGPNVHVGAPEDAGARHIAAYDPATRELTALRAGVVRLTVAVNGVSRTVRTHIGD